MQTIDTSNIFYDIERHRELIKKQKAEIADRQMIIDSLMESMVRKIHQIYTPYSSKMLDEALAQKSKSTKEEREMYEFIKKDFIEMLFEKDERKDVEFITIIPLGYDHCVYNFQFKYKGIVFEVGFPNTKAANASNIYHMWHGMYVLNYEEKRNIYKHITESYYLDDIAKAIKDFTKGKSHE